MPTIYLSPSTQEYNYFLSGGTEEQYMNLLADYMEPYLLSSGIGSVSYTHLLKLSSDLTLTLLSLSRLHACGLLRYICQIMLAVS